MPCVCNSARYVVAYVLGDMQLGLALGVVLAFLLAAGEGAISQAFTSDPAVLACVVGLYPWVFATQPLNSLAFVWDGILYGANG
jgi:Na+-driven multidrug efflux pump